jgi:glycosyltransferase involved in cell wall biosynthesis
VIPTKTFQFIAMRKPTIVGDSAAMKELFVSGEHIYAVPMGDPEALADAILDLLSNEALGDYIASRSYNLFQERLTIRAIANQLEALCASVL